MTKDDSSKDADTRETDGDVRLHIRTTGEVTPAASALFSVATSLGELLKTSWDAKVRQAVEGHNASAEHSAEMVKAKIEAEIEKVRSEMMLKRAELEAKHLELEAARLDADAGRLGAEARRLEAMERVVDAVQRLREQGGDVQIDQDGLRTLTQGTDGIS